MMRQVLILTLASTTLASPLAAQSFEGAVSMTVTGDDGKSTPINYLISKDGKLRYDMSSPRGDQVAMIIDPAAQKMLMVMTAMKMYMERDMAGGMAPMQGRGGGRGGSVTRTGRTEMIAGYKCEHITVTEENGSTDDICVTSELGAFRMMSGGSPMAPPSQPGWAGGLDKDIFPLKVQKGDKVMLEVTKVEKKSLDAALFAPPAGFQKMDMGAMMKRP